MITEIGTPSSHRRIGIGLFSPPSIMCCSLSNNAAGDASLPATVFKIVAVVVATLVDDNRAAFDICELQSRSDDCLIDT